MLVTHGNNSHDANSYNVKPHSIITLSPECKNSEIQADTPQLFQDIWWTTWNFPPDKFNFFLVCQKCHREEIRTTMHLPVFLPRKLSPTSLVRQILFFFWNNSQHNCILAFLKSFLSVCSLIQPTQWLFLQQIRNLTQSGAATSQEGNTKGQVQAAAA